MAGQQHGWIDLFTLQWRVSTACISSEPRGTELWSAWYFYTFISDIQFDFQVSQSRKKESPGIQNETAYFQLGTTPSSLKWKKIHFILILPADWHEFNCPLKVQPLLTADTVIAVSWRGSRSWNSQILLRVVFLEEICVMNDFSFHWKVYFNWFHLHVWKWR